MKGYKHVEAMATASHKVYENFTSVPSTPKSSPSPSPSPKFCLVTESNTRFVLDSVTPPLLTRPKFEQQAS